MGALKTRRAVKKTWPYSKYPNVNFAICAPDYKKMKQSTRDAFDRVFQGMGKMQEQEQFFLLTDGRKIFFRTMKKDPNSVEGIPSCVFIWGDEAGEYPRAAHHNIQSRTAFMRGQVVYTTTPYAMNWVKRDVIDAWKKGDPDIDYFEWLSMENPSFPDGEFERQKKLLPPKVFRRKYMGIHEAMEGLIHEFDDKNLCDPFPIKNSPCYGGVDWGFDHPMSIVIRCFPDDGNCYTVSIFKKSGLTASQVLDVVQSKAKLFGVKTFYCGADRPDMIAELSMRGVPAVKYFEGNPQYREVIAGNQLQSELVKTNRYKVFKGIDQLEELEDEYSTYHWDTKEGSDYSVKEQPVKENDDLMDAERYVTIGTHHLMREKAMESIVPLSVSHHIDTWTPEDEEEETKDWDEY